MQSPKQVLVIDRFRPQKSGSTELIPLFKKTSNSSFDVVFPVTSTVSIQFPLYCSIIVKEGRKLIFLLRVQWTLPWIKYMNAVDLNSQLVFFQKFGQSYIDKLFEKQNALFVCYGLTGSGKSYTIVGDSKQVKRGQIRSSNDGLLLRSIRRILDSIAQRNKASQTSYSLKLSVVGVYEESSVDMLT